MTLDEIDRALLGWNQQLATVADNLLELQGDTTYQLLAGAGGVAQMPLTGETAVRVLPSLRAMQLLFQHFGLLQEWVDRIAQMRAQVRPMFGREQAVREMEAVLRGASIKMPVELVPLEQRTLLSGPRSAPGVRPEELLARMVQAYADARDAVLLVTGTWDVLAVEVDAAERELRRLQGGRDVEMLLDGVRRRVQGDPLGARVELKGRVWPRLEELGRSLRVRLEVQEQLGAGHRQLGRLAGLADEIAAAAAASRAKIAGCEALLEANAGRRVEELRVWLERLERRQGPLGPAEVPTRPESIAFGLRNWQKAADELERQGAEVLRLARLPMETRRELRGRFDALKAKARAYGLAEDAAYVGLAGGAEALLYARPTDLGRAALAVEAYEQRLSLGRRG